MWRHPVQGVVILSTTEEGKYVELKTKDGAIETILKATSQAGGDAYLTVNSNGELVVAVPSGVNINNTVSTEVVNTPTVEVVGSTFGNQVVANKYNATVQDGGNVIPDFLSPYAISVVELVVMKSATTNFQPVVVKRAPDGTEIRSTLTAVTTNPAKYKFPLLGDEACRIDAYIDGSGQTTVQLDQVVVIVKRYE